MEKKITVFLSLGSSLSFVKNEQKMCSEKILQKIGEEIQKWGENFQMSHIMQTPPWGGVAKNVFYNAACRIDISPENLPEKFLEKIQNLEKKFGRTREVNWGDRTVDIDIIFWGKEKISRKNLTIPHPLWKQRDFVVEPLQEIMTEAEFEECWKL
jgi:2-amino-4-hydroxy-6-hydroxymethyldihydropteridine diphosphokinase